VSHHHSSFRELEVWHAAMDLALACYRETAAFPSREWYGLASQIRRAATSIPSNIAEGHSRRSRAAYAYHLAVALGSHAEVETQIELARRLSLTNPDTTQLDALTNRTGQMLSALYRSVAPRDPRVPSTEPRVPSTEPRVPIR